MLSDEQYYLKLPCIRKRRKERYTRYKPQNLLKIYNNFLKPSFIHYKS